MFGCLRYGNFLHGPIELISKKGVYAFRDARGVCFNKIDQMAFGEDFFAKQCWDMIKARRFFKKIHAETIRKEARFKSFHCLSTIKTKSRGMFETTIDRLFGMFGCISILILDMQRLK